MKPQKAQYNSCNFLDHIPSTWITVENLELIHATMRVLFASSRAVIRQTNRPSRAVFDGGTLDNFADRMALCRRQIFQMSALSTSMLV